MSYDETMLYGMGTDVAFCTARNEIQKIKCKCGNEFEFAYFFKLPEVWCTECEDIKEVQIKERRLCTLSNSENVIDWMHRMMQKTSYCGAMFPEVLAYCMDEEGNDEPSNEAVKKALEWESDISEFEEIVNNTSGRFCSNKSFGCYEYCKRLKRKTDFV